MATGELTIDLGAITRNWLALAEMAPTAECGAVVKADGYGLGMERVAKALAKAGARSFFVAVAEEGLRLREALGSGPDIYVFSGHMRGDAGVLADAHLIPLLNSRDQITRHLSLLPDHHYGVQLDSGMNRLGLEPSDWRAARETLDPALVMSHLACADAPDHPQNAAQLNSFREMTEGMATRRSLAATGGTLLGAEYHFDMIRPGIGSYGGLPFERAAPVVQLRLPVVQTRRIEPGESVGYGATFTAETSRRIATVSSGYADGLIRALSGGATLWHGDVPCPLAGRVSMDLMGVDVSALTEDPTHLDILNDRQTVDDLAGAAGTIGYEILTALGARYSRTYLT